MKKLITAVLIVCGFATSATIAAAPVNEEVRSIIQGSRFGNLKYAVYAVSLPKNKIIADINKDEALNPASCMKLVTTAAALKYLGEDYRFPTAFYTDGTNLWVKGFGDPSFVIERLEETADRLVKAGLPATIGNIYIDDTYFDDGDFPGRQKRSSRSYNALTSAVALNHSAITVEVFPGPKAGRPTEVKIDAPGFIVKNKTITVSKGRSAVKIKRMLTKHGDTIFVSGRVSISSGGIKRFFNVTNPPEHFGNSLKALLIERGVGVSGGVKVAATPQNLKPFFSESSPPLSEIIKNMNKFSNNFMAEQLTKAVGAKVYGAEGTTEKGTKVLAKYLESLGHKDFYVENGSGLSYANRLSAFEIFTVMEDVYKNASLRGAYIDSLSSFGVDGTLKRCDSDCLNGRLKAKTGSLNGISTLAGFLDGKNNETILFVIMLNGGKVDFMAGRKASQKIAESFLRR